MRKIIISMHVTLDGYVAGPNGEMDWINFDDELFKFVGKLTDKADTVLYGRKTFEMMDAYWPDAGSNPAATEHDLEHSEWYNRVLKVVLSKTITENGLNKVRVIKDDIIENIIKLKQGKGKNILIFGSPTVVHTLFNNKLIDDIWLFVNPVVIGTGIPLFNNIPETIKLKLHTSKIFSCGVVCLHYSNLQ